MPLDPTRIRAVFFDVDGTLSNTDDLMVARFVRLLKPFHFLFPSKPLMNVARRIVMASEAPGNFIIGIPDQWGLDDELIRAADWLARLSKKKPGKFLLVPGVEPMLSVLSQRYPLAVISARDERTTLQFLDQFDLVKYFTCIATGQTCEHTKPYPDPLLWAADQLKVPVEACVMIGDTTVDIRAGKAAGTQTVGVLCGFGERPELEHLSADLILDTTAQILEYLP